MGFSGRSCLDLVLNLGFGSRPPCCTPLTGSTLASCRWKPCMWGAPRGLEGGHTGDVDTSWAWAKANLCTPSLTGFTPEMRYTKTWSDKNMSTKSLKWQIYVDHFGSEIKIYCKTAVVALDPLRQGCRSWLWTRAGRWKALWRMQPDCSQISQFIYWIYWAFGWCWMVMVCYGMLWWFANFSRCIKVTSLAPRKLATCDPKIQRRGHGSAGPIFVMVAVATCFIPGDSNRIVAIAYPNPELNDLLWWSPDWLTLWQYMAMAQISMPGITRDHMGYGQTQQKAKWPNLATGTTNLSHRHTGW